MNRHESGKSTERTRLAEKFIKDHPTITGKRTIARLLVEQYPDVYDNDIEKARHSVRTITFSNGNRERAKKKEFEVVIQEQDLDYSETWHTPYEIKTKSIGVISDLHGQFMDQSAVNTAFSILKESGVKDLLINGDLIDNYYLSKFQKKEGRKKVIDELNYAKALLEKIRPMFENVYFKRGNHDEYVDRFLATSPGLEGLITLDERLTLTKLKIKEIHNLQEMRIGDLAVFHGHEKSGFFTPELVAKSFITWYQKYTGKMDVKIMFGHHHIVDNYIMRNIDGSFAYGYGLGWLGKRLSYNPYPRWSHGMAIVKVEKGIAHVNNFEI